MTYVTEIILEYRVALRSIWNEYYWPNEDYRNFDSLAEFDELKLPLFTAMVAKQLAPAAGPPATVFGPAYSIAPKPNRIRGSISIDEIIVDRAGEGTSSRIWKQVKGPFRAGDISGTILDFYDWQGVGWKDYRYFEVLIEHLEGHPEDRGRHGLVEVLDADVYWNPLPSDKMGIQSL